MKSKVENRKQKAKIRMRATLGSFCFLLFAFCFPAQAAGTYFGSAQVQIQRPNQLPVATNITDTDYLPVDQNAAGVRKLPMSLIRQIYGGGGSNGVASNLIGFDPPSGGAAPGTFYLQLTDTNRQWWVNMRGTNWEQWATVFLDTPAILGVRQPITPFQFGAKGD